MKQEKIIHKIDAVRDAGVLTGILADGGVFPLVVTGGSMSPYLHDGRDTVHLRKTEDLQTGKILFFRRHSGELILHRLRRIMPDGSLLMNGDAQHWCEVISRDQVLAEVLAVTRKNGKTRNETEIPAVLWRLLWYPTRPVRPLLWGLRAAVRRIFRPGRQ